MIEHQSAPSPRESPIRNPQSPIAPLVRRWPLHGWIGLALAAVFWALNWGLPCESSPTTWGFFPMWLGYCLAVDALVFYRKGSSMLARSPAGYVALFVISAPAWWLFELLNARVQNWHYEGGYSFGEIGYAVFASLSFSTVIPAVFGSAELASTFGWIRSLPRGPSLAPTRRATLVMFAAGAAMFGLLMAWPLYFFPFLWLSVYFLLEPLNVWLGNRSLLHHTAQGDWRPYLSLAVGCLVCGFFWELWNYHSWPKWKYDVPWVSFFRVFEMPLLGYGGYVPFSWELFALYHLVRGGSAEMVELRS